MRKGLFLLAVLAGLWAGVASAAPAASDNEQQAIRLAIVMPAPPSRLFNLWRPVADYMERRLGRPVQLLTPKGLDQVDDLILKNEIDAVYINAYAYYVFKREGKLEGLMQMRNIEGNTTSLGKFLVRSDSGIETMDDLRGRRVSLISPLGAGAYLAPRAYFAKIGFDMEEDLDVEYAGDVKRAIYSVLLGESSAAALCGVNYNILNSKMDLKELKVLASTERFPEALVAVRPDMQPSLKRRLADFFTRLNDDPEGQAIAWGLRDIKVGGFIPYDPAVEQMTEKMMLEAGL